MVCVVFEFVDAFLWVVVGVSEYFLVSSTLSFLVVLLLVMEALVGFSVLILVRIGVSAYFLFVCVPFSVESVTFSVVD